MSKEQIHRFLELSSLFSKPHPWHGLASGEDVPRQVTSYIEIVPGDTMKYELDKISGYLKVDRPQRFSNICPAPYGFVPQTLCGEKVGEYCMNKTGLKSVKGDNDPLDICVITERNIPHGNLIMDAIPVGGLRMIDGNEADDKILAVMKGDAFYGTSKDISDIPDNMIERLSHYFLTYKQIPFSSEHTECEITDVYGKEEAWEVINRSVKDYIAKFNAGKKELFGMIQEGLKS